MAARCARHRTRPGRETGAPRRRRESALRPAADRHRNPCPALAEPGRGRLGRGVHPAHQSTTPAVLRSASTPDRDGSWSSAPGSPARRSPPPAGSAVSTVTVAERGPAPLVGALGGTLGALAAKLQREHGVDLRCGVTVTALEGDGRLTGARFSDGTTDRRRRRRGRPRRGPQHRVAGRVGTRRGPARSRPATRGAGPSTCTGSSPTTSSSPATWPGSRTRSSSTSCSPWSTGATRSPRPRWRPTT